MADSIKQWMLRQGILTSSNKTLEVLLRRLRLFNFRVYPEQLFLPTEGLNVLTGPNGAGKTAILEAIHLLSAARSFRTRREPELCLWGQTECLVEGLFETDSGHHRSLRLSWTKQEREWKKRARFQGDEVARLSDFLGCVPLSLFTPSDLNMITGAPSERRRYLDLMLSKMYPLHLQELARLKQVLSSRNALLRQQRPRSESRPWDQLLYQLCISIGKRRVELVSQLNDRCQEISLTLTGDRQNVKLKYKRCWPQEWEEFQEKLNDIHQREKHHGSTLVSPQRDDLDIQRQDRSLKTYGSQGEQRLAALCLRLVEAKQLALQKEEPAILLLDDAFSELDPDKRERLLSILPEFSQVLVTSATPLDLGTTVYRTHKIENGKIE